MERPLRADARRNYERVIAAAAEVFAEQGADGSLEEIARRAGVGSATLHRRFASRRDLLLAVFQDGIESLGRRAAELARDLEPGPALVAWLRAVATYTAEHRGLAVSLLPSSGPPASACHATLDAAGEPLLRRARETAAVRPDVTLADLLTLVNAIAMATERDPGEADRLVALALRGIHFGTVLT